MSKSVPLFASSRLCFWAVDCRAQERGGSLRIPSSRLQTIGSVLRPKANPVLRVKSGECVQIQR